MVMQAEHSISVVVPLYNKEDRISQCLQSVLQQTIEPSEIIIVNDGSTDNSLKIAKTTMDGYKGQYTIIDQDNQGVSVARNTGIQASKSDFVALLDADDEWYSLFIEKAIALINNYPDADLYCFAHNVYDPNIGLLRPKQGLPSKFRGYVNDFFESSLQGYVAKSSKVFIRKEALFNIGGFPENAKVCEDIFVWIMLANNGSVVFDSYISTLVNKTPDNSREKRKGEIPYPLIYFSSYKKFNKLSKNGKKYIRKIYFNQIYGSLLNQDKEEAKNRIKIGNKLFPLASFAMLIIISFLPKSIPLFIRKLKKKKGISFSVLTLIINSLQ